MIEAGLAVSRFVHYSACLAVFGALLFPLYAFATGAAPKPNPGYARPILLWFAGLALLSGLSWFLFAAANMAGDLNAILDWDTQRSILFDMGFGQVWLARGVLALLLLVLVVLTRKEGRDALTPVIAAALLASLAGAGHAQADDGLPGAVHAASDGIHLLASGAWLGGLLPLGFLVARARATMEPDDVATASAALSRFSGMGSLAVALLVATGLVNSFFLVGTLSNLLGTAYGRLLIVKLVIFGAMLILAALNRFWLVPKLAGGRTVSSFGVLQRLRGHVLGEQLLGVAVIAVVSMLGMMEPAINQGALASQ